MNTFYQSNQLYSRALEKIPGGVNSPVRAFKQVGGQPIFIKQAAGSRFTDADGHEFVDYCQSWGPLILGHSHPQVVEAVQKAAPRGLSYGACHPLEVEFADTIMQAFPEFDQVRLVSSGTEAVMTALRLARGFTGRDLVVKFAGGYHGHFDGMLVKAGSGLATQAIASSAGIPEGIAQTTMVLPFDDAAAAEAAFAKYGEKIAAVIIEPLPGNNGLLVQRKEFLNKLRQLTQTHQALLIFDEVISGFRLHYGGYFQLINIVPDLITLGKIIGGGMPLGAIVGKMDIMQKLSPQGNVYQAGTLSGNPISLAAGKTTLDILRNHPPYQKLENLSFHFAKALQAADHPFARVQSVGSLLWLYLDLGEFPRNAETISVKAMERFTAMYWTLIREGIYLPPSSYELFFLSAAHTEAEVEKLAQVINSELKKLN
jgi:glutamate-1-semialdehyde 2,1-aminomutase